MNKICRCLFITSSKKSISVFLYALFQLTALSVFAQLPNITYVTPKTYKINSAITPLAPTNTGGSVPAASYGAVTTVVNPGSFSTETSSAVDVANNAIYVCDYGTNQIKKVDLTTGHLSIFAGTGAAGIADGPGNVATFYNPDGIVRDAAGNLYVCDLLSGKIRKITPDGTVSTLAGNGNPGNSNGTGAAASFNNPRGITLDAAGNVYVADMANNSIRKITPSGVTTTVSNGFSNPTGVDIDAAGYIYVSEWVTGLVKKISPSGTVTTFASNVGNLRELRVDATGTLYVADQDGNTIKKISPTGVVTTLTNEVNGPIGLTLDGLGNIYVTNSGINSIVKISLWGYSIDKPLPTGLIFDSATGTISGTPTALSPATNYTITAFNQSGSASTTISLAVTDGLLPSVITLPSLNNAPINGDELSTGVSSTNTETPIILSSSDSLVATVGADGNLIIHGPGVTTIIAKQAGNANYAAAQPVSSQLKITVSQYILFPAIANQTLCSPDFTITSTDSDFGYGIPTSGIPITYTSSNQSVATVTPAGLIHIVSVGTTKITANQAGNNLYDVAASVSQTLTVLPSTAPAVTISTDKTSVCVGASVTYTANVSNIAALTNPTYQWTVNGTSAATTAQLTIVPTASDIIACTVTNNASCPASTNAVSPQVNVVPINLLDVSISSSATGPVCPGTTITFKAKAQPVGQIFTYQWMVNGLAVGTDSVYTSNAFLNGDQVTCTVNSIYNFCTVPKTSPAITVAVSDLANTTASVVIIASANNVYAGNLVTFTAAAASVTGTLSYQWQINGKNVGTNSSTFSSSTLINNDQITCIVSSSTPCTVPFVSNIFTETILPPLAITPPNTFTPNGDGINDLWEISGLYTYTNCQVTIYNRYGAQVFYSRGYAKPWDGTFNGASLPAGTYYYVIELNATRPKIAGFIALIK